jgi:hypothetical protein
MSAVLRQGLHLSHACASHVIWTNWETKAGLSGKVVGLLTIELVLKTPIFTGIFLSSAVITRKVTPAAITDGEIARTRLKSSVLNPLVMHFETIVTTGVNTLFVL